MSNFFKGLFHNLFKRNSLVDNELNARLEIRLNCDEKLLWKEYAKFKGTDLSKLIRQAVMKEIDEFISINK